MNRLLLAFLVLLSAQICRAQDSINPIIPADLFFENSLKSDFKISPSGKYFAEIFLNNGTTELVIIDVENRKALHQIPLAKGYIDNLYWVNDGRLVFESEGRIFLIDRDGENTRLLVGNIDYQDRSKSSSYSKLRYNHVVNLLPSNEDEILVETFNYKGFANIEKVNLFTGEKTIVADGTETEMNIWILDSHGKVRLGARKEDSGIEFFQVNEVTGDVMPFTIHIEDEAYSIDIKGETVMNQEYTFFRKISADDKMFLGSTANSDTRELISYDLRTRDVEIIISDQNYDAGDFYGSDLEIYTSPETGKLSGIKFEGIIPYYKWFDKSLENTHNILMEKFPAYFNDIIDVDKAKQNYVVHQWNERKSGSIGVFNIIDSTYTPITFLNEDLDKYRLTKVKAITFTTRDGERVSGYLNMPSNINYENIPLVVIPHGGPWARDYFELDGFSQFFANRGYATLRVNFRGSTGFGKKFLNAGISAINTVMIDDIADGVKWTIDNYAIDPSDVYLFGHSYGGYATYMSLMKYPDIYNSAVALSAPTNIKSWMKELKNNGEDFSYNFWNAALGDKNSNFLKQMSPVNHAENINRPLMIVHGRFDPVVPLEHAEEMYEELQKQDKEATLRVIEGVGHSLEDSKSMGYILEQTSGFFTENSKRTQQTPVSGN